MALNKARVLRHRDMQGRPVIYIPAKNHSVNDREIDELTQFIVFNLVKINLHGWSPLKSNSTHCITGRGLQEVFWRCHWQFLYCLWSQEFLIDMYGLSFNQEYHMAFKPPLPRTPWRVSHLQRANCVFRMLGNYQGLAGWEHLKQSHFCKFWGRSLPVFDTRHPSYWYVDNSKEDHSRWEAERSFLSRLFYILRFNKSIHFSVNVNELNF